MISPVVVGVVPTWISVWITPLWLLGLGALLALFILLTLWGILFVASRRAAKSVPLAVSEGVLAPILVIVGLFGLLGIGGASLVRRPADYLLSLTRFWATGTSVQRFDIDAPTDGPDGPDGPVRQEIPIQIIGDEMASLTVSCENGLVVSSPPDETGSSAIVFQTDSGVDFSWSRQGATINPVLGKRIDKLLISNLGETAATLTVTIVSDPLHPESAVVFWTALCIAGLVLFHLVMRVACPKVSAIALATTKSETAQPVFFLLLVLGIVSLFLFIFIPYHTFGEDIKVLKNSGLTLIMVFGIIQAIWAASNSISDELEGRTALTVLSKPIGRRQFVIGKFTGITWSVALMFIVLGVFFLFVVSYKVIFEARESAMPEPNWQVCYVEVIQTVPGLVLGFLEAVVLTAISVAISTRLPMLPNGMICFAIYIAGHLTPLIVQSSLGEFEPVQFVGQLIATIFPVLEYFSTEAAVAAGRGVPVVYIASAFLYCVLYSTIAMLLALALFEDRDVA